MTQQTLAGRGVGVVWRGSGDQAWGGTARLVRSVPAVVSSGADHILVVMRETDVRHVSRVPEVTLVFGLRAKVNRDS